MRRLREWNYLIRPIELVPVTVDRLDMCDIINKRCIFLVITPFYT